MKQLYFFFLILGVTALSAQTGLNCGTDAVMKRVYDKNPALRIKREQHDREMAASARRTSAITNYIIPVVFHVLHLNGPENISDDQVRDGLKILNRDFAKRNADTSEIIPAFKAIADSVGVRFVLATKDPNGNCTNGIVHYYDPDTDWNDTSITIYSHTWDPTRYLNVYLVRTITMSSGFGAAGYTYLPGTWLPGDPSDAIVVLNNYFGTIGTGNAFLSRVLTHEVGHWLDLNHVFGTTNSAGVNCSGDDFVNDTPPTIGYLNCPNPAVPSQYQTCSPGVSENFQNYMDYSYCCRMFTQGQAARMQLALQNTIAGRNNLWTNANLIATGVISPAGPCVPVADFKSNRVKTCSGAPVTFKDASWNGQPLNYYWSFPGGTPAISTASAPVVTYANPGNYAVTYSVSNAAGTSTPVTKTGYINVTSGAAAYSGAWTEGFESGVIPNGDWQTASSSGAVYWVSTALASYSGAVSAYIPRENNTRKTITSMTGPLVNISGISNPALSFKVANGDGSTHTNTLQVHVSTDCGTTWSQVYSKWGTALVTSASTNTDFIPASRSEWRTEVISLSAYASSSALNVRFTYIRDTMPGANNTFIDNINIDGGASVAESSAEELLDYAVFPNPSQGDLQIAFSLLTPQKITLSVYDINGKLVLSKPNADALAGRNVLSLKGNDLATGLYLLQLEIGQKRFCKKLAIE